MQPTTYLHDDILFIENFFSTELLGEILNFQNELSNEEVRNYAGRAANLNASITAKIENRLKEVGISPAKVILARLRATTQDDVQDFKSFIHIDQTCRRVLVVYLANTLFKDQATAGTLFWRHKISQKIKADVSSPKSLFMNGIVLQKDSTDLSKWSLWMQCPFTKNAGIVFDSGYFHSPPLHDSDKADVGIRLTLDVFLN